MEGQECNPWNTYNITNEYIADALLFSDYDTFSHLIVTPAIVVFGVLTNLVFLVSVVRLQRMKTITNYYFSALATCDIMLLLSGPMVLILAYFKTVGRLFQGLIIKNQLHCILLFSVASMGYCTSLVIISLVSTERFYGLCYPLQHRAISGKGRTFKLLFGAFVVGLAFTCINMPSYAKFGSFCVIWPDIERFRDMPTKGNTCSPISFKYHIYFQLCDFWMFIVAFLYNSCLYMKIMTVLRNRAIAKKTTSHLQADEVRKQVARVLIVNGLVFFICQGPFR